MAYSKTPSYLWKNRTGLYHFKLGIPAELQEHYPHEKTGKPKTHIVVSLETHDRRQADKSKLLLLMKYRGEFARLTSSSDKAQMGPLMQKVERIRNDRARLNQAQSNGWSNDQVGEDIGLTLETEIAYDQLLKVHGEEIAERALAKMVYPDRLSMREGLGTLVKAADVTAGTLSSYRMVVDELLHFMGAHDCYPEEVTEDVALRYVDSLNAGTLSIASKSKRLGGLRSLWKHMNKRKGWRRNPWRDHILTKPQRAIINGEEQAEIAVRPFTDEEAVRLFTLEEPKDNRKRRYTRGLFRELYALGFITGMRLNEIASLRRKDVTRLDNAWRVVNIRKGVGKTSAAERQLPVCHPVALAILDSRLMVEGKPESLLFAECTPDKAESKPGKKVGDAMSNERMSKLGFTPREVDFHSTRRNFATLLEQQSRGDAVAQQRYFAHDVPTLMHRVYSGGTGIQKLKSVVEGLRYSADVEEAFWLAVTEGNPKGFPRENLSGL